MTRDDKNTNAPAAAAPESEQGYNGWTNYETWLVSLWLTSDRGLYEYCQVLKEECPDAYDFGQSIKEFIEDGDPLNERASLYADLLSGALSLVNWYEVARDFLDE